MIKIDKSQKPYKYIDEFRNSRKIYDSINNKFKIDDKVEVIDNGQFYSSYESMIKAMKISTDDWMVTGLRDGQKGYIVNIKMHENKFDIIYGVQINDKVALVSEEGLKKIENYLPDRLFEI